MGRKGKKKEEENKKKELEKEKECKNKIIDVLDKSLKLNDDDLANLQIDIKIEEANNIKTFECKDVPKLHSKIDEKIKQLKNKAKKECQSKINEVLDKSLKLKDEELIKLPLE